MKRPHSISTTLLAGLAVLTFSARADFVASRAALGANDYIDWAQLGPSGPIDLPAGVTSQLGLPAQLDNPVGNLLRFDQGVEWGGDFAPGDALVETDWSHSPVGTVLIDFAVPVYGAGAQLQASLLGPFTGEVRAYDAAHVLLESYTLAGVSGTHGDGSALFFGIVRASADIDRIEFDLSPSGEGLAINRLSILSAVPEPSTLVMAVAGTLWLALRRRPQVA